MVSITYRSAAVGMRGAIIKAYQRLPDHGVWIIEGLHLSEIEAGRREMICLPIRLGRRDAGLAHAMVKRRY